MAYSRRFEAAASLDPALCSPLFAEQTLPANPGVGARLLVGIFCIRGFAGTHEAVSGAVVGYGVVGFAGRLHLSNGIWNGRVDACIVPGIEAVDRGFDARHRVFIRRPAVENKRGRQIAAISSEPESLTAAPAIPTNEELARSEEHTSELQSRLHLVCRLLLEKKNIHNPPAPTLHLPILLP